MEDRVCLFLGLFLFCCLFPSAPLACAPRGCLSVHVKSEVSMQERLPPPSRRRRFALMPVH